MGSADRASARSFGIGARLNLTIFFISLLVAGITAYSFYISRDVSALAELAAKDTVPSARQLSAHAGSIAGSLRMMTLFVLAVGALFVVMLWIEIRRIIVLPLGRFSEHVRTIADGNLDVEFDAKRRDEIGMLAELENSMVVSLNAMVGNVLHSSDLAVSSMNLLLKKQEKALSDANDQLQIALQISDAAEQMGGAMTDIAGNAAVAMESAQGAQEMAGKGKDLAGKATSAVNHVEESTVELAELISRLNARVHEIGEIVTVINDIADQTNLLALNAAIEAARAGEQGRGFSVVADEVRKLAERTIRATSEISSKINAVQSESMRTAESMSKAAGSVTNATDYIDELDGALTRIVESVVGVRDQITHIAMSSEKQADTASDTTKLTEDSLGIAGQGINESKAAMTEAIQLIIGMSNLRESTGRFIYRMTLREHIGMMQTDHIIFLCRVQAAIKALIPLDPEMIEDHRACRFGRWYYSASRDMAGHVRCYDKLEPLHEKFHALGRQAVAAMIEKKDRDAGKIYIQMRTMLDEILEHLEEIKAECDSAPHPMRSK